MSGLYHGPVCVCAKKKRSGDGQCAGCNDCHERNAPRAIGSLANPCDQTVGSGSEPAEKRQIEVGVQERAERERSFQRAEQPAPSLRGTGEDQPLDRETQNPEPEEVEMPVRPAEARRREGEGERGKRGSSVAHAEPPCDPEQAGARNRKREQDRQVVAQWKPHGGRENCRRHTERECKRVRRETRTLRCPDLTRRQQRLVFVERTLDVAHVPEVLPCIATADHAGSPVPPCSKREECEEDRSNCHDSSHPARRTLWILHSPALSVSLGRRGRP